MTPSPAALLALAVLGFVPGALLYRAIRPAGSRLECVALAPVLSLAFVFLFGEFSTLTGVPFAPAPYLVALGLLAVVAGWRRSRLRRPLDPSAIPRTAALLLAGGIALSAMSWVLGIHGLGTTPPYTDSVNHGLMAAQVADRESLDPGRVLGSDASDSAAETHETAYYPLAIHGNVALANGLFGIGFADGLLAVTFLFAVVVLPTGLFLATRALIPGSNTTAGFAALLGATTGFFPLLPMSFGGLPLVVGLAMVPAVAVTLAAYFSGRDTIGAAAIGVLGAVGILGTHTSELPLLAIFVACMALESLLRGRQSVTDLLRRATVAGALFLLLVAPSLQSVVGGTTERSGINEGRPASVVEALADLRGIVGQGGGDLLLVAATVGIAISIRRRRHAAMLGALGCNLALFLIASCVQGPLRALTVPWYQHPGRIALNLALVIPFFAAVALVDLAPAVARRLERARPVDDLIPALAVGLAMAVAGFAVGTSGLRTLFHDRVVVGQDAKAAFTFLKAHVPRGERVLNDANTDGSMWMYAFDGVVPLVGLRPARHTQSWTERVWLLEHVTALGQDPRVEEYLRKYNVRFVYFDDRTFSQNPHHVDGQALRNTAGLCERFRRGTVHVYEIVGQAGCPMSL
ncbi:MAG: D-galactosaminyltransferase [Actinomycetota bacterium]|jgi:hypothetical protein|nr:D-galactosaminyltransferase [Actinomycetota bacterium]